MQVERLRKRANDWPAAFFHDLPVLQNVKPPRFQANFPITQSVEKISIGIKIYADKASRRNAAVTWRTVVRCYQKSMLAW